jgi:hypothetical protein
MMGSEVSIRRGSARCFPTIPFSVSSSSSARARRAHFPVVRP